MQQEGFGLVILVMGGSDGDIVATLIPDLVGNLAQKTITGRTRRSF
jgi:hypothetical protein